jgi:glycosyltransferase involved in cell wall biosynthesis
VTLSCEIEQIADSATGAPTSSTTAHPCARPRRILFVDHTAALGGGEIALLSLVRRLDRRRYHPIVVLFTDGPLAEQLRSANIETHILPIGAAVLETRKDGIGVATLLKLGVVVRSLRHAWRLRDFIRARDIDLVHTNSLKSDLIGGLAARAARVPVIWHVRDRITADYLPAAVVRVFRLLCRAIPTFIVGNSNATLETLHLPANKAVATVYSGIDHIDEDDNCPSPSSTAPRIGLVGRITPWKGQHIFIRAAAKVLKTFPAARFQVIGAALFAEQEYEREVHALAEQLGIAHAVEFTGFRDDARQLIAGLDLLVHASTSGEPFGQVIVQGMAAGKPVVATDGGGVPEIVIDGQTGLLVPMDDVNAMASAICRVLVDPARAAHMGRIGRQRVREHFMIERSVERLQRVYDELLEPHETRGR